MNIVTSICVDEEKEGAKINYPSTLEANGDQRRAIYWKCAAVLLATSLRCNPDATLVLYTNDQQPLHINKLDIRKFLTGIGVQIRYLPFQYFKPPLGYSDSFRNAFYKLDVVKALGQEKGTASLLLDSDCVWTKRNEALNQVVESEKMLLYDVYESHRQLKNIHYQSRLNLGKVYKEINPDYPNAEPIHFGGEMIGGVSNNLAFVAARLEELFNHILKTYKEAPPRLSPKDTILDGDEFISSYVLNNMPISWVNADAPETRYIKRIWNTFRYSTTRPSDMVVTIWHMPFEKTQGFPLLYNEVIKKNSQFWKVPVDEFNVYLGQYLGVPKPIVPKRMPMLTKKFVEMSVRKVKKMLK